MHLVQYLACPIVIALCVYTVLHTRPDFVLKGTVLVTNQSVTMSSRVMLKHFHALLLHTI